MSDTPYWEGDGVALYHGDCLALAVWRDCDVLVTDPPYGLNYRSNMGADLPWIANDTDTATRDAVLSQWGDRPALVFATPKLPAPPGNPRPVPLVWDKGDHIGMGDLSYPWRPSYEHVWVYGSGWRGPRVGSVRRARVLPGNFTVRYHPTEKPVEIMTDLLQHVTPEWRVCDPFAGAGATLLAARDLGLAAVGVELDERYCEIAATRLSQSVLFTGVSGWTTRPAMPNAGAHGGVAG